MRSRRQTDARSSEALAVTSGRVRPRAGLTRTATPLNERADVGCSGSIPAAASTWREPPLPPVLLWNRQRSQVNGSLAID